jgi:uncharacterized membrane protein YfbV (UPF0208 family)
MIAIAFLLMLLPIQGLIWLGIRHERQQMARQYRAAVERIQVRGLR